MMMQHTEYISIYSCASVVGSRASLRPDSYDSLGRSTKIDDLVPI